MNFLEELDIFNEHNIVVIGYGKQDADFIKRAVRLVGDHANHDTSAARLFGARHMIGSPEGIAILKHCLSQQNPFSMEAMRWLAHGERGRASNTLFTHLVGLDALGDDRPDHPHDDASFRRCRLLLESVPECRGRIGEMARHSAHWAQLVAHWPHLCRIMDEEAPHWREKNGIFLKTLRELREVLEEVMVHET